MLGLQNTYHTQPEVPSQNKAPETAETTVAVVETGASDKTRNETAVRDNSDRLEISRHDHHNAELPELLGPPPSFSANVLEAERAELKEHSADNFVTDKEEPPAAPSPTISSYGGMREDPARMLDVSK